MTRVDKEKNNLSIDSLHLNPENEVTFSYSSLAKLIQQHGLAIFENSPLLVLKDTHTEIESTNTIDAEFNNPVWKEVLIALCNPDFKQTSFTIFPDSIMGISYCINQKYSDTIVACQILENKQIKISFPCKPSVILTNLFNTIHANNAVYSKKETLEVSKQGLLALFAAIDTIKEILLVSLISRQYITDLKLPRNQLNYAIETSLNDKHNDTRWLVTLLRLFDADLYEKERLNITQNAFDELESLGLIIDTGDNSWTPTSELMDLASSFLTPLPAFYQEASVISSDAIAVESNSLTIRSANSLCLIDFDAKTKREKNISLRWLDKNEYWLEMMGRFMPTKTIIEPEPKQVVEKKESTTVSKSTKKSSPEPIYKCPFCGAEVKKGQKFCTQCGAKLPENLEPIQEEQSVKRCPVCGAELKPGAKFCTQCGAKI